MSFAGLNLNTALLNALDEMGYSRPTVIQEKVFSPVMSGRDILATAQPGTGKTLAYLLPMLRQLTFSKQKDPRLLVLVPTRELVLQVEEEANKLTRYMNVRIGAVYGGTNMNTQKQRVMEGLDLLVATPGRLLDLYLNGALRLKSVQKLVLDEVDEMLGLGFQKQLTDILEILPEKRQTLLFSATTNEDVEEISAVFFRNPVRLDATSEGTPIEKVKFRAYCLPNFLTSVGLLSLLIKENQDMNRVLVFCNSRKLADRLWEHIAEKLPGICGLMHANKSQNFRIQSLQNFESGKTRVLIATDLIARGIDVQNISHVVHFDLPDDPAQFLHRSGRTGRADASGEVIVFHSEEEKELLDNISRTLRIELPEQPLPGNLMMIQKLMPDEQEPDSRLGASLKSNLLPETPTGGFHEKHEKNKKVNQGGSYRRKLAEKYKKPISRGAKRKGGK
ncbi:MAG: DEAD/DEAH box helicase [Bacteroidetes bacterium]|nr:DEAD/DEAH box helicase [Bacteroidota bacterium]